MVSDGAPKTWAIGSCGPLPADLQEAFTRASSVAMAASGMVMLAGHYAGRAPEHTGSFAARVRPDRTQTEPRLRSAFPMSQENREGARKAFLAALAEAQDGLRDAGVMAWVTNELTAVSEAASRFGHANAHKAAFRQGVRLLMLVGPAADPGASARGERLDPAAVEAKFDDVCLMLAGVEWPDFSALMVAIEVEACKAAAVRLASAGGYVPQVRRREG